MQQAQALAAAAGCPLPSSKSGLGAWVGCIAPKAIIGAAALDAIVSVLIAVLP
jgi:hypothetical protein